MWTKMYSKTYQGINKEDIWNMWADVNNWSKWDKDLEYCKMYGEFKEGNKFILKPLKGPKVNITLSEVIENKKFTDYSKFPGAVMYDAHELEETPEGLCIKSVITVTGFLSFIWVKLVAKHVADSVPKQMDALVQLVRSR